VWEFSSRLDHDAAVRGKGLDARPRPVGTRPEIAEDTFRCNCLLLGGLGLEGSRSSHVWLGELLSVSKL